MDRGTANRNTAATGTVNKDAANSAAAAIGAAATGIATTGATATGIATTGAAATGIATTGATATGAAAAGDINIDTRFVCLIGTPLTQSFAARMQNAGFAAAGVNMRYFYNQTNSSHLGEIINGIRHMPAFAGAAVTKPNKEAVLAYLDELDPLCEKIGSCNTIVKDTQGRLKGYNTDYHGFLQTFRQDARLDFQGLKVFCIGAGGVARPICSALAYEHAAHIFIEDLNETRARTLVENINKGIAPRATQVSFGDFSCLKDCDVVINASGMGMGATIEQSPLPKGLALPGQFFFDACYNPRRTRFLLDAQSAGARVMNGLYMSLYQGCMQHMLWTGKNSAPEEVMRAELQAAIEEIRG